MRPQIWQPSWHADCAISARRSITSHLEHGPQRQKAADRASESQSRIENVYRRSMSALVAVDDLREVAAKRELHRRLARASDDLPEVAERVWYSVLKDAEPFSVRRPNTPRPSRRLPISVARTRTYARQGQGGTHPSRSSERWAWSRGCRSPAPTSSSARARCDRSGVQASPPPST